MPISAKRRLLFTGVLPLLCMLLCEVLLQVAAPIADPSEKPTTTIYHLYLPAWNWWGEPPLERRLPLGEVPGIAPWDHVIEVNRWGFMFPEGKARRSEPGELRIAAFGGSTVESVASAPERRWTALLEQRLKATLGGRAVTVLNLGISGQPVQSQLASFVQLALDLDLDAAIFLLGANDAMRFQPGYDELLSDRHLGNKKDQWRGGRRLMWLVSRSQLVRRVRTLWPGATGRDARPYFMQSVAELAALPETELVPEPEPRALELYARKLVTLQAAAAAHGVKVLFVTQPYLWRADATPEERARFWMLRYEQEGRPVRLRPEAGSSVLDRLNRTMLETGAAHGFRVLDLQAEVPKSLEYFYDDVHYTDAGNALVAERLEAPLLELLGP